MQVFFFFFKQQQHNFYNFIEIKFTHYVIIFLKKIINLIPKKKPLQIKISHIKITIQLEQSFGMETVALDIGFYTLSIEYICLQLSVKKKTLTDK